MQYRIHYKYHENGIHHKGYEVFKDMPYATIRLSRLNRQTFEWFKKEYPNAVIDSIEKIRMRKRGVHRGNVV